jgi:hypothetical protein
LRKIGGVRGVYDRYAYYHEKKHAFGAHWLLPLLFGFGTCRSLPEPCHLWYPWSSAMRLTCTRIALRAVTSDPYGQKPTVIGAATRQ